MNELTDMQKEMKRKARRHLDSHFRNVRLFGSTTAMPENIRRDLSPVGDFYFVSVFNSANEDFEVKFLHHHDNKIYFEGIKDLKAPTFEDIARAYLIEMLGRKGTREVMKIHFGAQSEDVLKAAYAIVKGKSE